MVLWRKKYASCDEKCDVFVKEGLLTADCSGKNIQEVPQSLDDELKVLDISNNAFGRLTKTSFARYHKLVILRLSQLKSNTNPNAIIPYDRDIFSSLLELVEIEMINTRLRDWPSINWPPRLKNLTVTLSNFTTSSIQLSHLANLLALNLSGNLFETFPPFHPDARISIIDLSKNPLEELTVDHIAPLCHLKYLSLEPAAISALFEVRYSCQCQRIDKWMKDKFIEGSGPLNCTIDRSKPCDKTFDQRLERTFSDCLDRIKDLPPAETWAWLLDLLMFAVLILIISIIVSLGWIAYLHRHLEKVLPTSADNVMEDF